jgi:hypothetical protein
MADDPTCTDPDKYTVVFENDRVRVLEYRDSPALGAARDVQMQPGQAHWLPAQRHVGENIGTTGTHVVFVELKG